MTVHYFLKTVMFIKILVFLAIEIHNGSCYNSSCSCAQINPAAEILANSIRPIGQAA